MQQKTCFVIMAIGDQSFPGYEITSADLKARYDDLIREAILRARPNLEVKRADEVAIPGTITTDIITRIMHSDYVLADVTYPNPNVYYELGLRHACKNGTIIVRDKKGPKTPFDISHLRHIQYDNTPTGLKKLAEQLETSFSHFEGSPDYPDNHLQELAKLTGFTFPEYESAKSKSDPETEILLSVMQSPELLDLLMRQSSGETIDQSEIMRAFISNPQLAGHLVKAMKDSGEIPSLTSKKPAPNRPTRKKPRKKR